MNWNIKTMLKQSDIKNQLEITNISIHAIIPNDRNFYAVKDTADIKKQNEQLSASIKLFGILTPLLVKPEDDKYKIISGHRRWFCSRALYNDGDNSFAMLPCIVDDGQGGTSAEEMKLILLNSTTRRKTDYELTEEISRLKKAITEYKESGHKLPCRVQDLIAETIGLSKSTVGRHEAIDKNLIPDAKKEYKKGNISMSTAAEMAAMPAADQKAVYENTAGKPKLDDVKKKKQQKPEPHQETTLQDLEEQGQQTMFDDAIQSTKSIPVHRGYGNTLKKNVSFTIGHDDITNTIYSYISIDNQSYMTDLKEIYDYVKQCLDHGAKFL